MSRIESYSFGKVTIDGQGYRADLLILPDGVRPRWRRQQSHELLPEDLQEIVASQPQVLIVGTGNVGMMHVPEQTAEYLEANQIRVEVLPTAKACQRFNELAGSERVAAALHLTC